MMIFTTADHHFGHANILRYCSRPFKDVEEHDETLIKNWNAVVGKEDTVYHLGDFAFGRTPRDVERYVRRLNGKVHLIRGNHDKKVANAAGFAWKSEKNQGLMISVEGQDIFLFHFACRVWPKSHHGAWHLYGHSHGGLPDDPRSLSFDVGVDAWNFIPVSFEQVKKVMEKKLEARRTKCP